MNSKLHAVCDNNGRPTILLLTEGQMSDHKRAALIYPVLPSVATLIADKGCDRDAFRKALVTRGVTPCIPPRARRPSPTSYCKTLYRQRHTVENMFAKLKDWRRIALRYDRCGHTFLCNSHCSDRDLLARQMSPDPEPQRSVLRRSFSTPIDGQALGARYHVRVALLYAIETALVDPNAEPIELLLALGQEGHP